MQTMTNNEVVEYLGLPPEIINNLATQEGSTWTATANEFLSTLINKIVYSTVDTFGWDNPFKKYDSFPVNYGDTIENIYVETPKGYKFNKDATDPFTKANSNVKTLYAKINYEMQYEATIQDSLLRRAAINEYGFMNLVNAILKSISTAKNVDEYFATIAMLNNPALYGNSTAVGSTKSFAELDVSNLDTDTDKAKKLTEVIIDNVTGFKLPSVSYNASQNMTASSESDLVLIIKKDLLNKINLDYLTGVFNLNKIDMIKNIMVVEDFRVKDSQGTVNGDDIGFTIIDTRGFDNHVALQDGGLIYNPKGKYTNHFLNLWKIMAFKYFYNAVAYKVKWNA